jgi:hypothetical protein
MRLRIPEFFELFFAETLVWRKYRFALEMCEFGYPWVSYQIESMN